MPTQEQEAPQEAGGLGSLHPKVRAAAQWALRKARELGIPVTVTSATRTLKEQEELREDYEAGRSEWPANRPGDSAHNWGLAFDSTVPEEHQEEWDSIREEAGFNIPSNDEIHAEFPEWRAEVAGKTPEEFRASGSPVVLGMPGMPQVPFPQAVAQASARAALGGGTQEAAPSLGDRLAEVDQRTLEGETQVAEVPADTVATPEAVELPAESLGTRLAEVDRRTLVNEAEIAEVTQTEVATPEPVEIPQEGTPIDPGPKPELVDFGVNVDPPSEEQVATAMRLTRQRSADRLRPLDDVQERIAESQPQLEITPDERKVRVEAERDKIRAEGKDPDAKDHEGRFVYWERLGRAAYADEQKEIQGQSHRVDIPLPSTSESPPPLQEIAAEPALRGPEDAYGYTRITTNPFQTPQRTGRKVTVDDLKRVSEETGMNPFDIAYELGRPRIATAGAEIPFGASVSRGAYSGLRRYAQIFGADPDPGRLPERLRESGFGRFVGEALAATPAFVLGSGVVGLGMKGMGLSARMTPLSYSLTRSAVTGATLGIGKTPGGDEFSMFEMSKHMAEEAALWTLFDAGMLAISGRMAGMAQAGREIRGIRKQIKGGEQFVDPVLLSWENALHPNAARDWRTVANRVHDLWSANPENRFEAIVARTLGQTEAWGATVLKSLDDKTLTEVVAQVKAAMPEGYGTAVHRAGKESSLLILDEASLTGRSVAGRTKEALFRFQRTGELDENMIVDMLQRGMEERGGLPPLEVNVLRPETGQIEARYEFSFGETTNLLERRQINIVMPRDANPQELISSLAHELTHDMIVTSLGRNPQGRVGLIRELFHGATVADIVKAGGGRYRGLRVEKLSKPKFVGKRAIGASYNSATKTIRWSEEGMVAAWKRFRTGKTAVPGVYRPQNITTYQQFKRFAFEHERQHSMLKKGSGETKVAYESRINRSAENVLRSRPLQGGEKTWMRELRAVQRALHTKKLGSRKAGLAHIKAKKLDTDEFELISDFVEYMSYVREGIHVRAPTIGPRILRWAQDESLTMRSILKEEVVATEALLREYAEMLGSTAEDIMKSATKIKGRKTSLRQMATEQRQIMTESLAQFEREGAYDGMRAFLEGKMVEVERRFFKEGRTRVRALERKSGRYKTLEVDDVRLQYPTIQGNIRYGQTAINIINNILRDGAPKTLGVFVEDGRGGVGRAIFRMKDMVYFKGNRHELMDTIIKEFGDDFVKGLDDATAFLKYAEAKGTQFKGVVLDEESMLTIFADPTQAAMHYHEMAPELVRHIHGTMEGREFILSAEDVIAEGLYQAGIPARELENMAKFAMDRKALQLKELIDPDFAPQALDDIWADVLEAVHFFDEGGMRSMRHGSGRVTVFPDGTYGVIVNEGQIPGGQIAAILNSKEEAKAFVAHMSPSPTAPNLSQGSTLPDALATGVNPRGGARPFRWGETAESYQRAGGIDRSNDLDRSSWTERGDQILRGSERLGEGAKRFSKLFTSSRTLFQEYEKRGMGPVFKDIWENSQRVMNNIKNLMNADNAVFGTKKNGKLHSAISGTRDFQRRIQKAVTADRRPLLTQLTQAISRDELEGLVKYSPASKEVIQTLERFAEHGVDMRHRIAKMTGNMDAARRYLNDPERFIAMMESELRGSIPTTNRDLARRMMQFKNKPETITVEEILRGMGHTKEEAKLMQLVVQKIEKGEDVDLFGIARYFTATKGRKEFIAANKMSAEEVALSDELRKYIEEAMRVPGDLTEEQVKRSADVFLKTVLPEMKNFVEQGFNINHRTITKYFGNHNEFLHRRMVSGDLNVYVNDPGYLAWRTYRGKLMQTHWEPERTGRIKKAQQVMKDALEGDNNVPYKNVERYLEELEGIPHESFAQVEDALIGLFERVGLTEYVEPSILRDLFQKMNMVTYKATIPLRPMLLVRNASEVYRIGGITGGRSLGHGINFVMSPKTRRAAMEQARAAGALKPDLPVFSVDPSARTALRGPVFRNLPGGKTVDMAAQKMQQGAQFLDDVAEVGMGFYQRVDEYTRAIAYHSMQHRIRTNMKLANAGTWNEFIVKSKLSTFDKTELAEFENLWRVQGSDAAINYASVTFADKALFLYGNANHPVGWGSTYGVLFGQFGTWPVQYKDFLINGMTRGTGKDRLEFAVWNLAAPAVLIHEGKKIGIDLNSWWGVSSLAYTGGPYADASIDVVRAMSGNQAERSMAWSNLRRMNPASTPIPNIVVPNSFAVNDFYEILTGQRSPIELIVKTTRE